MTLQQAYKIQDKTIKELIDYAATISQQEITEETKKSFMSRLAAAYLPIVRARTETAQKKIDAFQKKYKKSLGEFEIAKTSGEDKIGTEEHEDWVEWSHWNHMLSDSLSEAKILEKIIYQA